MFATSKRLQPHLVSIAGAFVVVVCVSIVAVDSWRTWKARDTQLREGAIAARNLSRAISQHAADIFKESDTVVVGLVDRLESDGGTADVRGLHATMVRAASLMPQLQRLTIVDARGFGVITSDIEPSPPHSVADREYFRHHASDPSTRPFVGPPIRSKSSSQWIVTVSRRFNAPGGAFGGVVLASIDIGYFERFYETFDIGRQGALILTSESGVVIARRPSREDAIGRSLAASEVYRKHIAVEREGVVTMRSDVDGVERQIAFRHLQDFPLILAASLATEDTLAEWQGDAVGHALFVAILVGAFGLIGWWLVAQMRGRFAVEDRLRASEADLQKANARLASIAREDGLTGLANRRELDRVLSDEVARAHRARAPLALLLLDVDFFKLFNDFYGHAAGDQCLRQVAAAIAGSVRRPGDLVARYGGEEFAVVLPDVGHDGAASIAEHIRTAVRHLDIPHAASTNGFVTISIGVFVQEPAGAPVAPEVLIHAADLALYDAKRGGRDRVVLGRPLVVA